MINYEVRAFRPDGRFAYGAHFRAGDDKQALQRFQDLPFDDFQARLYRADRVLAVRPDTLSATGG